MTRAMRALCVTIAVDVPRELGPAAPGRDARMLGVDQGETRGLEESLTVNHRDDEDAIGPEAIIDSRSSTASRDQTTS